jgi:hypothetical protein
MQRPDHDQEAGLLDLVGLSLDDLTMLDDSVVANAVRLLQARRCGGVDYMETFDAFQSAL